MTLPSILPNGANLLIIMPPQHKVIGGSINLNVEAQVRMKTRCKLNVKDPEGNVMIEDGDQYDKEYHYVQFESVAAKIDAKLSALMELRKKFMNFDLEFDDWTITDLDNELLGNPHLK